MQTVRGIALTGMRRGLVIGALAVVTSATPTLQAQNATYPPQNPSPPKIEPQIVLVTESVVQIQWAHTLSLVNAPQNVSLLNPGQCIRVGVYSTGDNRDDFLKNIKVSFQVQFAGHKFNSAFATVSEIKQIKPEGGDFVSAALGAAGVEEPARIKTLSSLGASADHWCAPVDATDGTASVEVEVESASGHQALNPSKIQIESFESGSKKSIKDIEELGAFSQTYYRQPNPARLLPALQFVISNEAQFSGEGQAEIFAAFLSAALSSDPIAAQDFRTRITAQPPLTRALGLLVLRSAGYDISSVLNALSPEEQQKFLSPPALQDPFDLSPTRELFQHLDMLWAVFGATGQFKPVKTIASALSWRGDYEDFDKLRKTPDHPSDLTPSMVRGVVYIAAGWSLYSFQRNDSLVADYIDYMRASPDTPEAVKMELGGLSSNPAFNRAGGP